MAGAQTVTVETMTPGQCLYPVGANTIQVVIISGHPVFVCVSIGGTIIARITAGTGTNAATKAPSTFTLPPGVPGIPAGIHTSSAAQSILSGHLVDHRSGPPASNDSSLILGGLAAVLLGSTLAFTLRQRRRTT
ncbi:MAG: hypothetical protein DLM54_01285 [Acidimicrobiales bacterium]|nr:MAG: hypothetical protein DLM54_01285 [Acidimicrobiales bacterium]